MTQALDAAIAKLRTLPPDEQDRVGRWLLDELRDEEQWARRFSRSQDALRELASEAHADREQGRATELDPHNEKMANLRAAIDEGDASGTFAGDPFAEVRTRHGLPVTSR